MRYFVLLALFVAFLNADEYVDKCLDYDDKTSESFLKTKGFSEAMTFARTTTVETMKDYGFGICLEYFDLDAKRKKREMESLQRNLRLIESRGLDSRCITTNRGEKIKKEVENYVIDYKKKSIEAIKSVVTESRLKEILESPPSLRKCLSLYDSQEYDDEIKRIVKKYCKDCE